MEEKSTIKKYRNKELTIIWEPKKCIHSAICFKTLPKVYDPRARPWIKPEAASVQELKAQIDTCPSGALSYSIENESLKPENMTETSVEIMKDGPIIVKGNIQLKNSDGTTENKENITALCRCGASDKKPYCDGHHKKIGFTG
jgi:uncharacterized Fe-S cluster protein YjdI